MLSPRARVKAVFSSGICCGVTTSVFVIGTGKVLMLDIAVALMSRIFLLNSILLGLGLSDLVVFCHTASASGNAVPDFCMRCFADLTVASAWPLDCVW